MSTQPLDASAAGTVALGGSPVIAPIPGTSSIPHLEENVAAASLTLSDNEMQQLARA